MKRTARATTAPTTAKTLDDAAYNEAARLQAAVRDWIGYPVTMLQALECARQTFVELTIGCPSDGFTAYVTDPQLRKRQLERAAADAEQTRIAKQKEIADNAGK